MAGAAEDGASTPTMLSPVQKRCALVHACMGKGQRCMNACTKPSRVPESSWTYLDGRGRPVDMSTAPRDSAHLATPLARKVEMERRETVRHGAAPGSPPYLAKISMYNGVRLVYQTNYLSTGGDLSNTCLTLV